MKKVCFLILIIGVFLEADPSPFKAGDLDSDHPYGLTKDETYILKNKNDIKELKKLIQQQELIIKLQNKDIERLKLNVINMKMKLSNISQTLDGMQTIFSEIDDLNLKVTNLTRDSNITKTSIMNLTNNLDVIQVQIDEIKNKIKNNKKLTDNNIATIVALIEKLAHKIDNLQLKRNKVKNSFKNQSKQKLLDQSVQLLKETKFEEALEILEYLKEQQYKLPEVYFYLGEIKYKIGDFNSALIYYKHSMKLAKKSDYFIDDLLYHTAYSFQKLGKIKIAKKTYMKLIYDFPKSILVKYAKIRLKDLEKTK